MADRAPKPSFLADAVIGAHGAFAQWVFDVIEHHVAPAARRPVQRIDRFHKIDFATGDRPILLTNYPSAQLLDAIERDDVRVLFLAEASPLTFRFMETAMNVRFVDSLRSQTASAIANLAIGRSRYSRVLERGDGRTLESLVRLISSHMELGFSAEVGADIAGRAAGGLGAQVRIEDVLGAGPDDGLEGSQPLTGNEWLGQEILDPLISMARGNAVRPIVWPTGIFTFSDAPELLPPADPEITGPSRVLYYGPYLYLPPARYRVEVFLVFSDEIKAVPFVLEVHAESWLAKARIEERQPGRFRGFFHLDHYDATSAVEIRLRNETPVVSGRLSLVELLFFVEPEPLS